MEEQLIYFIASLVGGVLGGFRSFYSPSRKEQGHSKGRMFSDFLISLVFAVAVPHYYLKTDQHTPYIYAAAGVFVGVASSYVIDFFEVTFPSFFERYIKSKFGENEDV